MKKKEAYMNIVNQYNNYVSAEDSIERTEFIRVKEELKEYIERFLCKSRNEQKLGDLLDRRRFENKERQCSELLHNINRELPVDVISCKNVYLEYRTMLLMPWGSYVTIPQACIITCIVIICLWFLCQRN